MNAHDPNDPRNALTLVAQFCADYVTFLSDKPATAGAVQMQMKDAIGRIDAALQQLAMVNASAGAVPQ